MNRTTVRADHPNERPNYVVIEFGDITLVFSYHTCIAFRAPGEGQVVSENIWGPTTGRHINMCSGVDPENRVPREEFEQRLNDLMSRMTLEARPTVEDIRTEFLEVMQA